MIKLEDITIGQFAPRESVVHKLDPRTKILSSLFLMTVLLIIGRLEFLLVFYGIVILFFYLARLPFGLAMRNLRPFIWLFLLTLFFHGFFTDGRILWEAPFFGLAITQEGVYRGVFYASRIGSFMILASLLTLTTSPMAITDAIESFLSPFRRFGVPAHEIAMMLSISIRFIPILINEAERIRKAQISRGCQFTGHLLKRIRNMIPLIVPLFISAFRRANDLALAMDAKCYGWTKERTSFYVLRFRQADGIAFCIVLFIGLSLVCIRFVSS